MFESKHNLESVLQKMQNSLACTICLDLLNGPMTTKCGHTFCKLCLDKVLKGSRMSAFCPLCVTPITRRSAKQNQKIATLVIAVRNVILSIKKDCGIFEQQNNKTVDNVKDSMSEIEKEIDDVPIRRMTRKRVPSSHYSPVLIQDKAGQNSKHETNKLDERTLSSLPLTSKTLGDCLLNSHAESILSSARNLEPITSEVNLQHVREEKQLEKVEEWLTKNEAIIVNQGTTDNLFNSESFPNENLETAKKESCENMFTVNKDSEENAFNEWTSQASTTIFDYNEIVKKNEVNLESSHLLDEKEEMKEESGSVISEKENKSTLQLHPKINRPIREKKRVLSEPNERKKVTTRSVGKFLFESTLNLEKDKNLKEEQFQNANHDGFKEAPWGKDFNGSALVNWSNNNSKIETNHILSKSETNEFKNSPNSKGHNIRFASEVKTKLLETSKLSKLSRTSKSKKSPGWSRVAGARKDLRSKHMCLDIKGGEEKMHNQSKVDSNTWTKEPSQESLIAIEEDFTQDIGVKKPKTSNNHGDFLLSKSRPGFEINSGMQNQEVKNLGNVHNKAGEIETNHKDSELNNPNSDISRNYMGKKEDLDKGSKNSSDTRDAPKSQSKNKSPVPDGSIILCTNEVPLDNKSKVHSLGNNFIPFIVQGSLKPKRNFQTGEKQKCTHTLPCHLFHMIMKFSSLFMNYYPQSSFNMPLKKEMVNDDELCKCLPNISAKCSQEKTETNYSSFTMLENDSKILFNDKLQKDIISPDNIFITDGANPRMEDEELDSKFNNATDPEPRIANCELNKKEQESIHDSDIYEGELTSTESKKIENTLFGEHSTDLVRKENIDHEILVNKENSKTGYDTSFLPLESVEHPFPLGSGEEVSPIQLKRRRSVKRLESSSSDSEDNLSGFEKPSKQPRTISPPPSFDQQLPSSQKEMQQIDSDEMKDFERYDENVWKYFNEKKKDSQVEIVSDDDIIPGTEEVIKNYEQDVSMVKKMRQNNSNETVPLKSYDAGTQNEVVDIFTQDSILTVTTNDLNTSTRELFNKCNLSLNLAHKILNDSFEEKSGSDSGNGEKGNSCIVNEERGNASHSSVYSTESLTAISTQHKNKVENEVQNLKNRIKELEAEMNLRKSSASKDKEVDDIGTPSLNFVDLKVDKATESDLDSEELFGTVPCNSDFNRSGITFRNRKSARGDSHNSQKTNGPRALVCTGLSSSEICKVREFAVTLCQPKTPVLNTWSKEISHVVVKTDEEGMTERTLKYLYGVASGVWVLSITWIIDSLNSNTILPEDEYEALDCTGAPGPNRGRRVKTSLFSGCQFFLIPPFHDINLNQLEELVDLCGGSVVKQFKKEPGIKLVIVNRESDSPDPKLSSTIGCTERNKLRVSIDWVIECIGMYAKVSLSNYVIGPSTSERVAASGVPPELLYETQDVI